MKFSTVSFLLLAGCSTGIPHEIRDVHEADGTSRALVTRRDDYEVNDTFGHDPEDTHDGMQELDIDPEEQEEIEMGKGLKGRAIDYENDPDSAHLKPRANGEKYTVNQLTNERFKKPHAEIALIMAYNKYRKPLPNSKLKKIADHEAALVNNKLGKDSIHIHR